MQIQIVSKGIDVSGALQEEISGRVEEGVSKYFNRPSEAYVAVSREGSGFRVTVSLHLPSGVMLQAQGDDGDAYKAADKAADHLEKRLRRYKRKLKNHHNENKPELPAETTPITVFQGQPDTDYDDDDDSDFHGTEPVIVAETPGEMRAMTASMAVLELEAAGAPFLIFRNIAHNGVNIVYRRPDGHVGWIDPDRDKSR
ncbi:ribosome-associated translation inhibitor RaiA [Hyphobacterium sp. CCMP332]|uniref:ribosome hibernation-promoting factor, HPF/YfiA family n=1 Tax=Hyphobacterium sp. CCMP332 TaxID=2749086 RepID=UPI0016503610|nr:ribosome-associated translation inhibitor RaiA [Hyphobacterium sp. CCMP332]QNL20088.1 ribosome-associated translation inhibitor RaiA [Hyphobacterium sp. CCMP332]